MGNEKKKKLTLTNNTINKIVGTGSIRESFSHGKSKTVTVEVKKRRSLIKTRINKNNQKRKITLYNNKPNNITNEEWDKRLKVLKQSQKLKAYEEEKTKEKTIKRLDKIKKEEQKKYIRRNTDEIKT